jgi:hypothetical protein
MAQTQTFIVRRFSHGIGDSWYPHDGDFDEVVAKAVDKVREGKAGGPGLEVIELQILRHVRVAAEIVNVDVSAEAAS